MRFLLFLGVPLAFLTLCGLVLYYAITHIIPS